MFIFILYLSLLLGCKFGQKKVGHGEWVTLYRITHIFFFRKGWIALAGILKYCRRLAQEKGGADQQKYNFSYWGELGFLNKFSSWGLLGSLKSEVFFL